MSTAPVPTPGASNPAAPPSCFRRRGFSLSELLVVVGLLAVLLPGFLAVLDRGFRALAETATVQTTPQLSAPCRQLRNDLESAVRVVSGVKGWSQAPLVLELPGGTLIRYQVRDGALVRTVTSERERDRAGERIVVRPVSRMFWNRPDPRLVAVEITVQGSRTSVGKPVQPAATTVVCALRGAGKEVPSW